MESSHHSTEDASSIPSSAPGFRDEYYEDDDEEVKQKKKDYSANSSPSISRTSSKLGADKHDVLPPIIQLECNSLPDY